MAEYQENKQKKEQSLESNAYLQDLIHVLYQLIPLLDYL